MAAITDKSKIKDVLRGSKGVQGEMAGEFTATPPATGEKRPRGLDQVIIEKGHSRKDLIYGDQNRAVGALWRKRAESKGTPMGSMRDRVDQFAKYKSPLTSEAAANEFLDLCMQVEGFNELAGDKKAEG